MAVPLLSQAGIVSELDWYPVFTSEFKFVKINLLTFMRQYNKKMASFLPLGFAIFGYETRGNLST